MLDSASTEDIPQYPAVQETPELNPNAALEVELYDEPVLGQGRSSFLESGSEGIGDVLRDNPEARHGEDVAPPYGNAFMLLRR